MPADTVLFINHTSDNMARAAAPGRTGAIYREREVFLRDLDAALGGVVADV